MLFPIDRRLSRSLVIWILLLWTIAGRAEDAPYYEPDLSTPLFNANQISLSAEELSEAADWLAQIPRLDSRRVTARLCTMSLTVALHLEPRHRAALIANHWLRRGLPRKRGKDNPSREEVTAGLRALIGKLSDSSDDRLLHSLTTDILQALSPKEPEPEGKRLLQAGDDPWRGTIAPETLSIPVKEAVTFYLGSGGEVLSLTLRGSARYAHSGPAFVVGKETVRGIFEPGTFIYDQLHQKHPFVTDHLELTLIVKDGLSGSSRHMATDELALPVALLASLLFEPEAFAGTLLITGRLDAQGSIAPPPDLLTRMNRFDLGKINEKKSRIRAVVLPRTPALYWRDWLLFHQTDKVLACELFAVGHLTELQAICANDASLQERRNHYARIRRELLNLPTQRNGRQVLSALQQSPVLRDQLGVLARGTPLLLSAQLLLDYVHLPLRLRASLPASTAYLRTAAAPFLTDSLKNLGGSAAHKLCTETETEILLYSARLHGDVLPLASELSKIIDQSILPYARIRHKKTDGARRRLAEITAALAAWQARLDALSP